MAAASSLSAPDPVVEVLGREVGGFRFDLCKRNAALADAGHAAPKVLKTGTTIAGVVFAGGIVLGADTRSTNGQTVADKNCEKIHYIAPNIYCCGAGTAADTEHTTDMIASQLELLRLNTGTQSRVVTAMTRLKRLLFQYQGHVSAALVLGGVDITGPHLYCIYPHGSTDKLPFVTMGSGSLAAMSVFEADYRDDMTEEEAKKLVTRAICSGIFNDLGSGSNVDLCVIRTGGVVEMLRNYFTPNDVDMWRARIVKPAKAIIRPGTTVVLRETITPHKIVVAESSESKGPEEA